MATDQRLMQYMTCSKCGKSKRIKDSFYKLKNEDNWLDICKPCLTKFIDNRDPKTYEWILARFDVPYIEHFWVETANNEYTKNPAKFDGSSVLGLYLRTMKLNRWRKYGYADSDYLNKTYKEELAKQQEFQQQLLQEKIAKLKEMEPLLEKGEITQDQYDALANEISNEQLIEEPQLLPELIAGITEKKKSKGTYSKEVYEEAYSNRPENIEIPSEPEYPTLEEVEIPQEPPNLQYKKEKKTKKKEEKPASAEASISPFDLLEPMVILSPPPPPKPEPPTVEVETTPGEPKPIVDIDEDTIKAELEEEDLRYLALKWGINYKPSEWISMEELYCKYSNEYELNTDREDTLRKICKTSLLLDRALDEGEAQDAQKYAGILENLRKSGKFTDAQKKDEVERYLDSVGELAYFCEKEGGIIEKLPDPDEYPRDNIDLTIRDLQNYTRNLATNELGLSNLIESYIAKLEKREQSRDEESLEDGLITSSDEEEDYATEEDYMDFQKYIDNQIEEDALMVYKLLEEQNGA